MYTFTHTHTYIIIPAPAKAGFWKKISFADFSLELINNNF